VKKNSEDSNFDQYSSFAVKQMSKMGFKEGQGLGAKSQGIAAPIEMDEHNTREGLGYGISSFDFFVSVTKSIENTQKGFTAEEMAKFHIKEGTTVKHVFLSRFCGKHSGNLLKDLYDIRLRVKDILKDASKLSQLAAGLWPCGIADHMGYVSQEGLTLASLDIECKFSREFKYLSTALKFVDLNTCAGATEFLLSKLKGQPASGARIEPFDLSLSNQVPPELVSSVKLLPGISLDLKDNSTVHSLIEAIENFSGKYKDREGLHLFVGNLTSNLIEEEPTFHQQLLFESLVALSTLQKHGTFICRTHRALRFSEVGIIHILHLYFKKFILSNP